MLDRVGLPAAARGRRPKGLSGGEQQRVALARALVIQPDVLLLDEPLTNLDRSLRDQLRSELRMLQCETGVTTILVTHDQDEALAISDRIGVMRDGQIGQIGKPAEVYKHPQTPFVARALGLVNLLPGRLFNRDVTLVMIRPEECELNSPPSTDRIIWAGCIALAHFLGADWIVDVLCDNGATVHVRSRAGVTLGERVTVGFPESALWAIPDPGDAISGAAPSTRP
jgi:ABC-type Fe3+/spermidine/putrescine transport system ATPase subunit